jgi:outer membrane protein OmpA-like peptidoglycan-associated protein
MRNVSVDLLTNFGPAKSDRTGESLLIQHNQANLVFNIPINEKWKWMLGGGWTGTAFRGDKTKNVYESGFNGLIGLRYCKNADWSWTTTLMGDYRDPADQAPAFNDALDWVVRVGLVRAFGNNRTKHPCYVGDAPPPPPPPARQAAAPAQPAAQQPPAQPPAQQPPPQPARQQPPAQPAPAPTPAPRALMTFPPIYFDFDQSVLTAAARSDLDAVVRFMRENPSANVLVTGHTDSRGSDDYNSRLGARRATVARDYLVANGIAASRISTATRGESEPAESNDTDAGRARNRRAVAVEVRP